MILVNKIDGIIKISQERYAYFTSNLRAFNDFNLALETYLWKLSFDEVKTLTSIMYLGINKDYDRIFN